MSRGVESRPETKRRRGVQKAIFLNVPGDLRLRISPADFERLCPENRDLRLERTAKGRLIIMSPASARSGGRNAILTMRLVLWAIADGTGKAFDSSAGFTLPNGAVYASDASWVVSERWNALTDDQQDVGFSPLCPDFVVELRSRTDRIRELRDKLAEYIDQGARLGWLIDPKAGVVEVYRPGRAVEVLKQPATLSGEAVLPGFVLDLKGILDE